MPITSSWSIIADWGSWNRGGGSSPPPAEVGLNIKVSDAGGVGLDKGFAGWDFSAH